MKKYNQPHGIMFHHFHDERIHPQGQGSISGKEFKKMLLELQREYHILDAQDWSKKMENSALKEDDICITFDDNLKCQFDIALPVLEELNIKAFWFVYTSPLVGVYEKLELFRYFRSVAFEDINEFYAVFSATFKSSEFFDSSTKKSLANFNPKNYATEFSFYTDEDKIFRYTRDYILGQEKYYMIMERIMNKTHIVKPENLWITEAQIKYLAKTNHVIGLHSHSHPTTLGKFDYNIQKTEYSKNYTILSNIIGSNVTCVSYPCNSYNDDSLKIMKEMNIKVGFRANMSEGFNSNLEYPRLDHALLRN